MQAALMEDKRRSQPPAADHGRTLILTHSPKGDCRGEGICVGFPAGRHLEKMKSMRATRHRSHKVWPVLVSPNRA